MLDIEFKKIIVYGLGISGISTLKFFAINLINSQIQQYELYATDDNLENIEKAKQKLIAENFPFLDKIIFTKNSEIIYDEKTIISFSPGIPLYFPKPHPILGLIHKSKAKLACDIEIFYRLNFNDDFIEYLFIEQGFAINEKNKYKDHSTFIVAEKKEKPHGVTDEVWDYIVEHQLY